MANQKTPTRDGLVSRTLIAALSEDQVIAMVRGIDASLDDDPDLFSGKIRPRVDCLPIALRVYAQAMHLELETPTRLRRWFERLTAAELRGALYEAALAEQDTGEPWFAWVESAVFRITMPAFVAHPESDLALLHEEGMCVRIRTIFD
jgi:hypothetical protein